MKENLLKSVSIIGHMDI